MNMLCHIKSKIKNYVLPKEAEIFLNIQNELNITSMMSKGVNKKIKIRKN